MFMIQKKPVPVTAFCLDQNNRDQLEPFFKSGRLLLNDKGGYEVFTREADGHGQAAEEGDFLKLDKNGDIYPNSREFFLLHHRKIGQNTYEQCSEPLEAWRAGQPIGEEVQFLIRRKGLVLREEDPSHYFNAPLWGTQESAARDAVLVFYEIQRGPQGQITDADFNFVAADVFSASYEEL